jgi:hypothetical protein
LKFDILSFKKVVINFPTLRVGDKGGYAFKMIELETLNPLKIEYGLQDNPPVEEPPNEPKNPPVKEPGDEPTEPPPPAEPPVKEPPNEP